MTGTIYGYVRVSSGKQQAGSDAQRRALEAAGCAEIIEEQKSGLTLADAMTTAAELAAWLEDYTHEEVCP